MRANPIHRSISLLSLLPLVALFVVTAGHAEEPKDDQAQAAKFRALIASLPLDSEWPEMSDEVELDGEPEGYSNDPPAVTGDEDPAEPDAEQPGVTEHTDQSVPAGITLAQLESIAVQSHPLIVAAVGTLDAQRGQFTQAGLGFNPVLQYQSEEIFDEDAAGIHSVRVSQQFITANKLGIAQQVQLQAIAKQSAEVQRVELQVLTRVRTTFALALVAQRRAALTRKLVKLAERSVASVEALLQAEEVSKVSLLQAQVEVENARIIAENAATESRMQRRNLAGAVGIDTLSPAPLSGQLENGLSEQPWNPLLERIAAGSPELSAADSELQRARWALRHACAMSVPNITGQIGIGLDSITDDTFAVVGLSVPLPIRNRNQGNIRAARARIVTAEASIEATRMDLISRLADAAGRYQTALQRLTRLTDNVLPGAEETFALSQEAFEAGESDYLQLLAAQRTLISTELRILDALGQARESLAEIDGLLVTVASP